MAIRSFLAFELPADIKNRVKGVSEDVKRSGLDIRWVKVDNIHLTVVFIGNIQAEALSTTVNEVGSVCIEYGPFDISLKGLGVFPNDRRPRVLWIGLDGEIDRMSRLRDDLLSRLKHLGLKEEKRAFKPHLTLGRFRKFHRGDTQLSHIISQYKDLSGPTRRVGELVLFKSELKPGGAVYSPLNSWALKGER